MLRLGEMVVAVFVLLFTINHVRTEQLQDLTISNLLKRLQMKQGKQQEQLRGQGILIKNGEKDVVTSQEFERMIQQALEDGDNAENDPHYNINSMYWNEDSDKYDSENSLESSDLDVQQDMNLMSRKKSRPRKNLKISQQKTVLLKNVLNNVRDNRNLKDYSKIYLILSPKSNLNKKDMKEISNLISKLISKPSHQKRLNNNEHRHKGFLVRDASLRRRRDSQEMHASKNSMERKPKRIRNEFGGVRTGGRTGIPYFGHHGDIYEKDNM